MRPKFGWKIAVLAAIGLAAAGGIGALGLWAVSFARSNTRVLLPDDLALATPAGGTPRESAAFAGLWGGDRWDGGSVPHALAVERIDADGSATVVYAWGSDLVAHRLRGWLRLPARIANGHLTFDLPDDRAVDYSFAADGRLLGRESDHADWQSYVLLRHATASTADREAAIAAATERSDPLWQEIGIPEQARVGAAAGQSLTLRTTLYRTPLPGRQKIIVLNHGSTVGTVQERTLRFEAEARLFLSYGFSVAIPMRKGRGGSGGPLLETGDFETPPTQVQIDSGVEDIDAVVSYLRVQDYVDPDGIVVAGEGRGGLLAVAYAGRHPGQVKGVVNFSGAWWPASYRGGTINTETLTAAGASARIPMLWLYAEGDSYVPIADVQRNFQAFKAASGKGRLVLVPDLREPKTYDNRVLQWTAKWDAAVRAYLTGDSHAPAGAGVMLFDTKDPLGEDSMPVAVFYPSLAERGTAGIAVWTIDALRDAPAAEGRFPVILLSHGDGGHRLAHHDTATALARAGFMVVTPTHPGDHVPERDAWRRERVLVGREYDMRAALDAVLADPVLGPHADTDRIGAAGYSLGGYTALLLAGARPDFSRFVPYCQDPKIADATCAEDPAPPEIRPGLEIFRDPRIKSVFLMAPTLGYFFAAEGLRDVTMPVHIDDPEEDEVAKRPYDAERIRDLLPVPPEYARPARAGHYIYLAPCPAWMSRENPQICRDHPGVDRAAFHAALNAEMAAFFKKTLAVP